MDGIGVLAYAVLHKQGRERSAALNLLLKVSFPPSLFESQGIFNTLLSKRPEHNFILTLFIPPLRLQYLADLPCSPVSSDLLIVLLAIIR